MESSSIETNLVDDNRILRSIVNSTEQGILAIDNKGDVTHYNEKFKDIWKINEVAMNIDALIELMMDKIKCKQEFKEITRQIINKPKEDFNIIVMNNGKVIETYSRPLLDSNIVIGRVFSFRDVAQREKYYDALCESKERYRRLIDFFPDAVAVIIDYKIKFTNTLFLDLLGYGNYFEIVGRHIKDFVHKDYIEDISKYIYQSEVNNQVSKKMEIKLQRLEGTIIDVEITSTYLPWNGGNAFTIIVRDITSKKQTEIALEKSEEQYRKLIEFLPAGVIVHSKGKILFANSHLAKLIGNVDPKDLIGRDIMELVHPEYYDIVKDRMNRMQFNNESVPLLEETAIRPDGRLARVDITGTGFIYEGKKVCLIIIQDVTEKKKGEENTKLLNETLAYDKLRTEFFANLSHELRTPLNVIFGAIQVIDMRMKNHKHSEDADNVVKYIKIMKQNSYRLMRLVNNIIDVTKLDSGYLEVDLKNYNIIEIVENITQSVVEYALNKDIEIIFDTDIEEKIIACDPNKIERIMLNIISNAIKFTNAGGKIFVNMYDKNNQIEISIKDTGIGISEENINTIFKRFVQVDKSLTRNNEGSGIGLSLVKSFVELHGGTIEVISKLDDGSEFIIKLPVKLTEYDGKEDRDDSMIQNRIERINIEFSDIYS